MKTSERSSFPVVDKFVKKLIGRGYVRSVLEGNANTWIYSIGGEYRYCNNIGRQHKSNNVYFVMKAKEKQFEMTQRCYDPDCRGFESNPIYIDRNDEKEQEEQVKEEKEKHQHEEYKEIIKFCQENYSLFDVKSETI